MATLILGMARSGRALARLLQARGRAVVLADERLAAGDLPDDLRGLPFHGGPFAADWLQGVTRLAVSPGVLPDAPAPRAARAAGIPVSGELEEAFALAGAPVLAVTGTNGKSTTTTLLGLLLESQGWLAPAGGNLGRPFSELVLAEPDADFYVLEVSSFQAETFARFRPHAAALLNLTPDHLDRYGDAERYYAAKLRLFERLAADDWLVLPAGGGLDARLGGCPARRLRFEPCGGAGAGGGPASDAGATAAAGGDAGADGAGLRGGAIVLRRAGRETPLLPAADLRLVGRHNLANALAALACALPFLRDEAALAGVLRAFPGLPHRMEPLGRCGVLDCYNDSKATNVEATLASLGGLAGPLLLIAGGRDKGGDFDLLARELPQVRLAYGIGEAGPSVVLAFGPRGRLAGDLAAALRAALDEGRDGERLVLSPACASFDQYRDFEARGDAFRRLVREAVP
ncbi:MAG: UDP-N-acetylmuramoyl-L-alanine--D-glutamate ligase [Candidatus Krumholzibacteriota bacterium]|nr:UDP-N-acetylmuramoyl-L-alanine--D-glutamate ligase [Candidatus Krumholzibacteriota bacterium]